MNLFPAMRRLALAVALGCAIAFCLGCKGGPAVKVGACYVDENGREYCVTVEVEPGPDGPAPLPEKLALKPEGESSEKK